MVELGTPGSLDDELQALFVGLEPIGNQRNVPREPRLLPRAIEVGLLFLCRRTLELRLDEFLERGEVIATLGQRINLQQFAEFRTPLGLEFARTESADEQ